MRAIYSRSFGALGIILLFAIGLANASTINVDGAIVHINDENGAVKAIGHLKIGGDFYNVDFEDKDVGPLYTTYGLPNVSFTGAEAEAAIDAANAVLNTLSNPTRIRKVDNASVGCQTVDCNGWWFPASDGWYYGSRQKHILASSFIPVGPIPGTPSNIVAIGDTVAAWSVSVVPIPAAVWLLGSALGLLGWMQRKTA